jgi:hypothetical protein
MKLSRLPRARCRMAAFPRLAYMLAEMERRCKAHAQLKEFEESGKRLSALDHVYFRRYFLYREKLMRAVGFPCNA